MWRYQEDQVLQELTKEFQLLQLVDNYQAMQRRNLLMELFKVLLVAQPQLALVILVVVVEQEPLAQTA
jgi:ABC-type multidrug transport system permease subunit